MKSVNVNPAAINILQQPFVQVALPIIVALMLAAWLQNKRFDDMNRRMDEVIRRLDRIEAKLENHTERITRLEERTSLVR
jgi:GTPase